MVTFGRYITLETYDSDNELFKVIRPNDILVSNTKEDIIKKLNDYKDLTLNINQTMIMNMVNGSITHRKEEIINYINTLPAFKWIRIYYNNLHDLSSKLTTFNL